MAQWLIKNGHLIDPANGLDDILDIRIVDGKVANVGKSLTAEASDEIVDASGLIVSPGFIDIHCHLREPGQEAKEDLLTGTASAAAGGFTTILTMANTRPVIDQAIIVAGMKHKIQTDSVVRVEITGAVTKGLEGKELAEIGDMAEAGAKAFSDDGYYVSDGRLMRTALEYASMFNLPVISHSEDCCLVADGVMHEGCVSAKLGLKGRPAEAENIAVSRELMLAEMTGGHVHIAHVSSKGAVKLIREAKAKGIKVTAEVTPHHLCLVDKTIESFDSAFKVNPPLRTNEHIVALLEGLKDGTLDAIATDHAPHAYEEKDCEFNEAPCGFAGFETAFSVLHSQLVKNGEWTVQELIQKMTAGPAAAFDWKDRGHLSVGGLADLVLIDPTREWIVDPQNMLTRGKSCPFTGMEMVGQVVRTMVDGKWVYQDGKIIRH
ncbi:Dihydroorotase [Pragia fontium]|uniref:Dihydroorotase n=2 Tax=Pragia fontium TaxID=82985 RepID=A0AAJ4WA74_9GAMM|nr:dihydroorotase [Pragia fontium]AKJ43049.1 dihydroorotase [Pragia fontium]GKX63580.1 dihydroorotase [Pragia fontium]SFC69211.1 dihydroorotase [Pragia fontium DSM 5563 = ATCC 49100]SUB83480.1 Dihydroorotase [Pragia fontium]